MAITAKEIGTAKTETGRLEDWNTFSLVENIGTISNDENPDEIELVQSVNRMSFELWHESGLKMRINLKDLILECAAEFRAEIARRAN